MPVLIISAKRVIDDGGHRTSEVFSIPWAALANCPAARSCSSMAAMGVLALEALRAWDCAWRGSSQSLSFSEDN